MKAYTSRSVLAAMGFLLLAASPASAKPAYRAGWGGSINYNINRWHFTENNPVGADSITVRVPGTETVLLLR